MSEKILELIHLGKLTASVIGNGQQDVFLFLKGMSEKPTFGVSEKFFLENFKGFHIECMDSLTPPKFKVSKVVNDVVFESLLDDLSGLQSLKRNQASGL